VWKAIAGFTIGVALCLTAYAAKDITTRKPTGEIILLLGADANEQGYMSCPSCGLTMYMHIQFSNTIIDPIIVITYWYDHMETRKNRAKMGIKTDEWPGSPGAREW
jgi:hypothetical protein